MSTTSISMALPITLYSSELLLLRYSSQEIRSMNLLKKLQARAEPDMHPDALLDNDDIDEFLQDIGRYRVIADTCARELEACEAKQNFAETRNRQRVEEIEKLRDTLVEARRKQANKMEYEALRMIIEKTPTRAQSIEQKRCLDEEIRVLREQQLALDNLMQRKRKQYGAFFAFMNELSNEPDEVLPCMNDDIPINDDNDDDDDEMMMIERNDTMMCDVVADST